MSLSSQVSNHLEDALSSMRSALWHAAKNERTSILTQLAKITNDISLVVSHEEVLDSLDSMIQDLEDK
jgi:hypothetical protein